MCGEGGNQAQVEGGGRSVSAHQDTPQSTSNILPEKWGWQDETVLQNTADNQPTSCHSINKGTTEYKPWNTVDRGNDKVGGIIIVDICNGNTKTSSY